MLNLKFFSITPLERPAIFMSRNGEFILAYVGTESLETIDSKCEICRAAQINGSAVLQGFNHFRITNDFSVRLEPQWHTQPVIFTTNRPPARCWKKSNATYSPFFSL
jgi:hypothetical protein